METRVFIIVLKRAFVLFRQELHDGCGEIELVGRYRLECKSSARHDLKTPPLYELTDRGWEYAESSYQRLIPEMYSNMIHQLNQ